jgi:hypothetical protein
MEFPGLPGRKKAADQEAVQSAPMSRLEERREQLRERFAQLQWDLGGAAYEMAARDYFRLDVLAKMAARLQTVDAELAEIERMAKLERAGAAGSCPGCGSLYAQGAVYCWRCGRNIHETNGAVVSSAAAIPPATVADGGPAPVARPDVGYTGETMVHPSPVDPAPVDGVPDLGGSVRDSFVEMDLGPDPARGDDLPPDGGLPSDPV